MFDLGALTTGLLTGLREGVEAALIVSIVCAYLARTGNARHFGKIAAGVTVAIVVSAALGAIIFATIGELKAPYEQLFEAAAMLLAAAVVTWMLFWMRRQAGAVRGQLHRAIDRVLTDGSAWSLAVLAFTAVIREGLETSLFLVGQSAAASSGAAGSEGAPSVLTGALLGLLVSAVLGYGFYRGSRRLNLARFFGWTGVLLIFIAAGLLSAAVHELVEIGWVTVGSQTAFDISAVLPQDAGIGLFLRALFGYSSNPELVTLAVWLAYVVSVLALYARPVLARPAAGRPDSAPASQVDSAPAARP